LPHRPLSYIYIHRKMSRFNSQFRAVNFFFRTCKQTLLAAPAHIAHTVSLLCMHVCVCQNLKEQREESRLMRVPSLTFGSVTASLYMCRECKKWKEISFADLYILIINIDITLCKKKMKKWRHVQCVDFTTSIYFQPTGSVSLHNPQCPNTNIQIYTSTEHNNNIDDSIYNKEIKFFNKYI
jgi:hypothetical protein